MAQEFFYHENWYHLCETWIAPLSIPFSLKEVIYIYIYTFFFFPFSASHSGLPRDELASGLPFSVASSVFLTGGMTPHQPRTFILSVWQLRKGLLLLTPVFFFFFFTPVFYIVLFAWGYGSRRRDVWRHCWSALGHHPAHSAAQRKPWPPSHANGMSPCGLKARNGSYGD